MKAILYSINALLLISIAYMCVQIFYKHFEKGIFQVDDMTPTNIQQIKKTESTEKDAFKNQYKKIINRNLFNVLLEKKEIQKNQNPIKDSFKNLKSTDLDLTLWGTVTGTIKTYAVIEDRKNKLQALYQIGDKVQGAIVKRILRDKVILTYDHQDYILESDIKLAPDTLSVTQKDLPLKTREMIVNQSVITSSLNNINDLKRQIRIKPITGGGKSDGLLLYSIKPDSFFHTLGLKTGDIIRQVNGNPTRSIQDAVKIYQSLENPDKVKVSILRNGKNQEIVYSVKPDK